MLDVARRAGVHPATVSRALRDDPRISPAQRERIRRVAAALEYRKNPLIAALMTARRSRRQSRYEATLAYLTHYPAARAAFFAAEFGELFAGARARAQEQGYRLEEINAFEPALSSARLTEILRHRGIQGVVLAPLHSIHDRFELDWSQFATVAIGYSQQGVQVERVSHHHFSGLADAARACRAAGRRRLGLALPRRVHEKIAKRWLAALLLDQAEHPGDAVTPHLPETWDEPGFAGWFRRERPDAVLCLHVTSVQAWLSRLGRAAREVAVVSLDRRPRDRGIAGINQDYARIGAVATDTVIGLLQRNELGLRPSPPTILLDGVWVPGRSLPEAGLSSGSKARRGSSGGRPCSAALP